MDRQHSVDNLLNLPGESQLTCTVIVFFINLCINSGTVLSSSAVQQFEPGSHQFSTFLIFTEPELPLGRTRLTHTGSSGQNSAVHSSNQFRTSSALNPSITIMDNMAVST